MSRNLYARPNAAALASVVMTKDRFDSLPLMSIPSEATAMEIIAAVKAERTYLAGQEELYGVSGMATLDLLSMLTVLKYDEQLTVEPGRHSEWKCLWFPLFELERSVQKELDRRGVTDHRPLISSWSLTLPDRVCPRPEDFFSRTTAESRQWQEAVQEKIDNDRATSMACIDVIQARYDAEDRELAA